VLVALEREKRLVLRSIKELEFDRAMGKVADADFDEMVGRLRDRAVRLMQRIEHGQQGLRERVAQDLANAPAAGKRGAEGREGRRRASAVASAARPTCSACGTPNDPDARFCKQCGGAL
jgi:hypothetical protein